MKDFRRLLFQLATLFAVGILIAVFWPVLMWLAAAFLLLLLALAIGIPLWLRHQMKRNFREVFQRTGNAYDGKENAPPPPPPASQDVIDTTAVELPDEPQQ